MLTTQSAQQTALTLFPIGSTSEDGHVIAVCDDVGVILPRDATRHAARLTSYLRRTLRWAARNPSCVISHNAAAGLYGLPADVVRWLTIHGVLQGRGGNRRSRRLWRHAGILSPADIVQVGPIRLTSVARTLVDIARTEELWRAVAIADAALHRGIVTSGQISEALAAIAGQPGCVTARRTLARADGRSESVGESRLRIVLTDHGLNALEYQFDVFDEVGAFVGRVDAGAPWLGLAIEFDGDIKYTTLLDAGETADDVRRRQDEREARLVDAGFVVIRVRWEDLDDPTALVARIRSAMAEGSNNVADGRVPPRWALRPAQVLST